MTARERLVKMLRREAEDTRRGFPRSAPAFVEMAAYADLCETVAAEHAVEVAMEAL